jgi:hypothetical protein
MKTSTRIFIAALLFLLLSMVGYDHLLKKEFLTGRYKNKYAYYTDLKLKNFDSFDIDATQIANVKFIQGPYRVLIEPNALDYVSVKQKGNKLQIAVSLTGNYYYNRHPYLLLISCPRITDLHADAFIMRKDQKVIDTVVNEGWNERHVLISGFKQDSLTIWQDHGSHVMLDSNQIRSLNATIGKSPKSVSRITILKSNRLENVTLHVLNKSKFVLNDARIAHLNYQLADSAQLVMSGAANHVFVKP